MIDLSTIISQSSSQYVCNNWLVAHKVVLQSTLTRQWAFLPIINRTMKMCIFPHLNWQRVKKEKQKHEECFDGISDSMQMQYSCPSTVVDFDHVFPEGSDD